MTEIDKEKLLKIIELVPEIREVVRDSIREYSISESELISKKLSNEILERIKPMQESKITALETEVANADQILSYITDSFIGMWLYRNAIRKIKKETANKLKGEKNARPENNK